VSHSDVHWFVVLSRAAQQCIANFKARVLASTAWAFVMVGQSEQQFFLVLSRKAEPYVAEFKARDLANTT